MVVKGLKEFEEYQKERRRNQGIRVSEREEQVSENQKSEHTINILFAHLPLILSLFL